MSQPANLCRAHLGHRPPRALIPSMKGSLMSISEELTQLQSFCRMTVVSARGGLLAVTGLESQLAAAITRLEKPMTQSELGGIAEFLRMGLAAQRAICERQIAGFARVADSLQESIDFYAEIPGSDEV